MRRQAGRKESRGRTSKTSEAGAARRRSPARTDATHESSRLVDPSATPVSELMSRDAICVRPSTTLVELTRTLLENGISGAPVVDDDLRPVGMASRTDLVHTTAEADGTMPSKGASGVALRTEGRVRDIMTPMAFTIGEQDSVLEAASLMARVGLHRVVVVADNGRVAGVLSAYDVVTWIAGIPRRSRR